MEKDDCCGMELVWVKPTGSQEREEVSWFESAGVHVINDILYYAVTGWGREILLLSYLGGPCIPRRAVGCSSWAGSSLKTLLVKVQRDMLVFYDG